MIESDPKTAHFIKPCHRNDRACLKLSAQAAVPILAKGIPSLGMKPLDPMDMEEVKANRAGLMMHFTNTKVLGLKHCKVLDLVRATDSTTITLKCSVALKGSYSLGGKLLIVDISGVGPYTIFIHDIVVKVKLNVGEREEQGKRYWTINSWKHSADVTGQVRFNFHNLFNGNVALAKQILDYANQNWHTIFEEVSPPIVTAIVSQIVNETTKLFNQIPIDDLALD
ncbi:juvenile hormone binding protein [Danaus plexippus plexippus]|uniref:Juvenile hormone binding protein n=1 Tax=Danaus plexippus plexippus TaxID=278856 RepID=A0A212EXB5_DANPL|nr:juvenile hormone binding protein [Danaus plexippus plexippus]